MARGDNLVPYHFKKGNPGGPGRPKGSFKRLRMAAIIRKVSLSGGVHGGKQATRFEQALKYCYETDDRNLLLRVLEFSAKYAELPAAMSIIKLEQETYAAGGKKASAVIANIGADSTGEQGESLAEQVMLGIWKDHGTRLAEAEAEIAKQQMDQALEIQQDEEAAELADDGGDDEADA